MSQQNVFRGLDVRGLQVVPGWDAAYFLRCRLPPGCFDDVLQIRLIQLADRIAAGFVVLHTEVEA